MSAHDPAGYIVVRPARRDFAPPVVEMEAGTFKIAMDAASALAKQSGGTFCVYERRACIDQPAEEPR